MATTIHTRQFIQTKAMLFVALELSSKKWHVVMTTGPGQAARERDVRPGDAATFQRELAEAKNRFGLAADAPVLSCYEAGRDGFWVARWLEEQGVTNLVVDSSSIEVPRRGRRPKTDRVDGRSLLRLLIRYAAGERAVWRVVRVPTIAIEDRRHVHRALETLKCDRTRIRSRVGSLLATQGVVIGRGRLRDVTRLRRWTGEPLPHGLQQRLVRELEHLAVIVSQIRQLEAEQRAAVRQQQTDVIEQVKRLQQLRGVGLTSAWVFVVEAFSWRQFRNAREIGAMSGLAPTPYQSGMRRHEQGIAKTGNRRWRTMAIEIAWGWLRFQPASDLSRWYVRRFANGGPRARRIGLAALARKLLIALWRYLDQGVLPAGAVLKPVTA